MCVHPDAPQATTYRLDPAGRHRWWPISPCARVEVVLTEPSVRWSGVAYLDANAGDAPLEDDFICWHWSRAVQQYGAAILYDVTPRSGGPFTLALQCSRNGGIEQVTPPPVMVLPATGWLIARRTRVDAGHAATVQRTLEDTPFYARSVLTTRLFGESCISMHESLSLDWFRAPWVQAMLPFRMPSRLR